MDVSRLTNATAGIMGNKEVLKNRSSGNVKKNAVTPKVRVKPEPNKKVVQAALDRIIKNTRFKYVLKDTLDYFVVRIIDRDTDKIIREIPSKELQRVHEGIEEALGLLFDEEI